MTRGGGPAVALFSLAFTLACSVPPEHVIIRDFFAASRLRDLTALSKFATTLFEPREQGTVASFEIEAITERQDREFATKAVTVKAPVRTPDGGTVQRTLVVELRRPATLTESRPLYRGWKVVAVHP